MKKFKDHHGEIYNRPDVEEFENYDDVQSTEIKIESHVIFENGQAKVVTR